MEVLGGPHPPRASMRSAAEASSRPRFMRVALGMAERAVRRCPCVAELQLAYDSGLSYHLQGVHLVAYRPSAIGRLRSLASGRITAMKMSSWKRELSPVFSYHLNVFIQRPLPRIQAIFQSPLIPVRLFLSILANSIRPARCFSSVFVGRRAPIHARPTLTLISLYHLQAPRPNVAVVRGFRRTRLQLQSGPYVPTTGPQ